MYWTIVMLMVSNMFMTYAWYGHLNDRTTPLFYAILISWAVAFMEYCFVVPANRIGSAYFSTAQLKIIQEVISLVVFGFFSVYFLKEQFKWNYGVAFLCMMLAVFFMFYEK